jgi:hypothetical protein
MMKFLIPLISFFLGNAKGFLKEPGEALTQQLVLKIRSVTILLVITIAALALSCVGISLSAVEFAKQMDLEGSFTWTTGLTTYLVLTVLSLGTLIYSLSSKAWVKQTGFSDRSSSHAKSSQRPLENAVTLLLMDYLEERKSRRESRKSQQHSNNVHSTHV